LQLDAAPCGQENLDEDKVVCSAALNVWVEATKAKVFVRQFKHAMKAISFRHPNADQGTVTESLNAPDFGRRTVSVTRGIVFSYKAQRLEYVRPAAEGWGPDADCAFSLNRLA